MNKELNKDKKIDYWKRLNYFNNPKLVQKVKKFYKTSQNIKWRLKTDLIKLVKCGNRKSFRHRKIKNMKFRKMHIQLLNLISHKVSITILISQKQRELIEMIINISIAISIKEWPIFLKERKAR